MSTGLYNRKNMPNDQITLLKRDIDKGIKCP
jgi:hypothetical protein